MKRLLLLSIIVFVGQTTLAMSAYRDPNTDFHEYLNKQRINASRLGFDDSDRVMDKDQSISTLNEEQIVTSKISQNQALELFTYIRDNRDMLDQSNFKRRITWFYPDNGCYARSAIMQNLVQNKIGEVWSQIFLFGNLKLKTKYSRRGAVTWWYHVAPIVKTDRGVFVFDPSVNAVEPLALKDWLSKVNASTDSTIAICDAKAYKPSSLCFNENESHLDEALKEEKEVFFEREWIRLENLGLKPEEVLGEKPPWK